MPHTAYAKYKTSSSHCIDYGNRWESFEIEIKPGIFLFFALYKCFGSFNGRQTSTWVFCFHSYQKINNAMFKLGINSIKKRKEKKRGKQYHTLNYIYCEVEYTKLIYDKKYYT